MSFVKKDPLQFKSSKARPVSRITVPPPGAFTMTNEDAVASLLSDTRGRPSQGKRREMEGTAGYITLDTRGAAVGSGKCGNGYHSSREQQNRIAARNARAIAKHQASHQQTQSRSPRGGDSVKVPSFRTGTGGSSLGNGRNPAGSVRMRQSTSGATATTGTGSISTACLSEISHKKAKERELAAKLQLLQNLRDKDREVNL